MRKLYFALPFFFFVSCKSPKTENALLGEWQATALHNPQMEAILAEQKALLDTMTAMPEAPAYGMPVEITSLDSFKANGYRELEQMRFFYKQSATETRFIFRKDSVAILSFPQGADSARYSLEGDSVLVLNERALKNVGDERLVMQIQKLTEDSLTLLVPDVNAESELHFRKIKSK